jgi:hypothetical protein
MMIFSYLQCESVEERRAIIHEQDRAYEESLYIDQAKVSGHDHVCKFVVHFLGTCFLCQAAKTTAEAEHQQVGTHCLSLYTRCTFLCSFAFECLTGPL